MENHMVIYILPRIPYLAKFWLSNFEPKCCSQSIRLQDSLKCNISIKKRGFKLSFCMYINIKISEQFILLFLISMTRHIQVPK